MSDSSDIKVTPKDLERQLDDALRQTFPASDPVAVGEPSANEPVRPVGRLPALVDKHLVDELAKKVAGKRSSRS